MTNTEVRLRSYLGAVADSVGKGSVRPLSVPERKHRRSRAWRAWRVWLTSLAAALSVALVVSLVVALISGTVARHPVTAADGSVAGVLGDGLAPVVTVPAPSDAVLGSEGVRAARSRVVKVRGTATSCGKTIQGSGFVYAAEHILTNAHVVAGVDEGLEVTTESGAMYRAKVVFYDPMVDVAVLYVPDLSMRPLTFAGAAQPGDDAVVAGDPLKGPLRMDPARIAATLKAKGSNIYHSVTVTRQVYEIRGLVRPGDSGGPLLASDGSVYGVVFASSVGKKDIGFALTVAQVASDATAAATATMPVSTMSCDR